MTFSHITSRTAGALQDAAEVAVVAAVTGCHGNPTYARQLLQQEDEPNEGNEGADVKETELDEETRRQIEAQIEDLIVSDTLVKKADDEGVRERQADGEAEDEAAEGRIAGLVSTVTL